MPSMRRRTVALVTVSALALAGCGSSEPAAEEPVAAPVVPAEEEPEHDDAAASEREDYWSDERLAALEAAKSDYVAPTPSEPSGAAETQPASQSGEALPVAPEGPGAVPAEGLAPAEAESAEHRLEGYVDVPDHVWLREYSDRKSEDGDACRREQKGHQDVEPGAEVTVRDGEGRVLAKGKLEEGALVTSFEEQPGRTMDCRLPFTVAAVPTAAEYAIAVAKRPEVTYSFEELQRRGWRVAFAIDW